MPGSKRARALHEKADRNALRVRAMSDIEAHFQATSVRYDPLRPRLRLRIRGAVQGVGFRPYAHRLAGRLSLAGFVRNDAQGVLLEVEGAAARTFVDLLPRALPPLARIEALEVEDIAPQGARDFAILDSLGGQSRTRIIPDVAVCDACLDDMFDPQSRFHLYPFTSCTHCGPRFTLTRALPYDRAQTSMAEFPMCAACRRDYTDPAERRFHAEPIACPSCGPQLSHPLAEIVAAIRQGAIVALKGIGGFHLICDARSDAALARLRQRKAREAKPFAVMVANAASAALIAEAGDLERRLLRDRARPIVLMRARPGLSPSIAPSLGEVGVMLPYAPLHHLLFHAAAGAPDHYDREEPSDFMIVATSANRGGEPLCIGNDEAQETLAGIADIVVTHDRAILARADDSLVRVIDKAPVVLRRSRGFVPDPIDLGMDGPCVIAAGAHLKASVTVTRGREAFLSQHIGDLDTPGTIRFYEETIRHLLAILDVKPELAACDLHPDFRSTLCAEATGLPLRRVQHHVAHVAAVAAEHGIAGPVIGMALDGHGYGDDGGAWGGELFLFDGAGARRLGHLQLLPLPGGDRAAREPWRMGVGALAALGRLDLVSQRFAFDAAGRLATALGAGLHVPQTTSMGRLFDAAAALAGLSFVQHYEGQAAMEFEALVEAPQSDPSAFSIADGILDFRPLLACLVGRAGAPREAAELFHGTLVAGLSEWAAGAARVHGLDRIILGGGCLMNKVLAEGLVQDLRQRGLIPFIARAVPSNDGGLSLGQAAVARAAWAGKSSEKETSVPCASPFQPA